MMLWWLGVPVAQHTRNILNSLTNTSKLLGLVLRPKLSVKLKHTTLHIYFHS